MTSEFLLAVAGGLCLPAALILHLIDKRLGRTKRRNNPIGMFFAAIGGLLLMIALTMVLTPRVGNAAEQNSPEASVMSLHRINTQVAGPALFVLREASNGLPAGTRLMTIYGYANGRFIACLRQTIDPNGKVQKFSHCDAAVEPVSNGRPSKRTRVEIFENFIEISGGEPFRLTWGMPPGDAAPRLKVE